MNAVGDEVDVKIGNIWCPAVITAIETNGNTLVDLDDPLPTLAACGKSHPRVPTTALHGRRVSVNRTGLMFHDTSTTDICTIRVRV